MASLQAVAEDWHGALAARGALRRHVRALLDVSQEIPKADVQLVDQVLTGRLRVDADADLDRDGGKLIRFRPRQDEAADRDAARQAILARLKVDAGELDLEGVHRALSSPWLGGLSVADAFESLEGRDRAAPVRDWARVLLRAIQMGAGVGGGRSSLALSDFARSASELEVPANDADGVLYRLVGVMSVWSALDHATRDLFRGRLAELICAGCLLIADELAAAAAAGS